MMPWEWSQHAFDWRKLPSTSSKHERLLISVGSSIAALPNSATSGCCGIIRRQAVGVARRCRKKAHHRALSDTDATTAWRRAYPASWARRPGNSGNLLPYWFQAEQPPGNVSLTRTPLLCSCHPHVRRRAGYGRPRCFDSPLPTTTTPADRTAPRRR
jgi:hypothetical protein